MNQLILNKLLKIKEYPCVSILLPTYRTVPDNQKTAIRLKKLAKEAEEKLLEKMSKREANDLIKNIHKLAESVDTRNNLDGLALFISKDVVKKVDLPFTVRERVIIDETFATRDIIKGINRSITYYVLEISLYGARLFSCIRDEAHEIDDFDFPVKSAYDDFYLNPKDMSREKEKWVKEFFNKVDKQFQSLYNEHPQPLILAGVTKNLAFFREVCDNKAVIAAILEGNYEEAKAHEIVKKAWPLMKSLKQTERDSSVKELQDAIGAHKSAFDIADIWRYAIEGRVNTLLVEDDYEKKAYLNDKNDIVLENSKPEYRVMEDAIDELAEIVVEKGGNIVFLENGQLNKYGKIAAILRY